ncbi:endoglucanase [Bosea sp. 124]|nr:endoglucanase [Bosea sp. 124]
MSAGLRATRRSAPAICLGLYLAAAVMPGVARAEASRAPTTAFAVAASDFLARFVTAEGRVVDDYNGAVSHSEGQGYGMLVAALTGDRAVFDRIWSWTRRILLIRADGLAAWRWVPNTSPPIADQNNATDGDLLIAWALIEAQERWPGSYGQEGLKLAQSVAKGMVFERSGRTLLRPAAAGFNAAERQDAPVVNLSYWVFPALLRLSQVDPAGPWAGLIKSGLELIDSSRFGPSGLPSDWISIKAEPAPSAHEPARFGYDAVRIPLYLIWAFPEERLRAGRLAGFIRDGEPQVIDLPSGRPTGSFGGSGFKMLASLLRCEPARAMPHEKTLSSDFYYPAIIGVLSLYAESLQPACQG